MDQQLREETTRTIKDAGVEFIHLWFTDILGFLKTLVLTVDELDNAMTEGMGFDGSSIQGFSRTEESDMIAIPDPSTLQLTRWRNSGELIAIMHCNIVTPDGEPFAGDPREVLKRQLRKAAEKGYTFYVGPELEYYYLKNDKKPKVVDTAGYFDQSVRDLSFDLRGETVRELRKAGIQVEYSHHEVGPSQHEIDLRFQEALKMADAVIMYRVIVKEVALRNGVYATFMPKPIHGEAGNGMHVHQSLFTGDKNAFFDANARFNLSDTCMSYIAGLLEHAPAFSLVTNQWVNSYKRLVSGYEAPIYICWAHRNRSSLVRIPLYKPGKEQSTRIELRSPDPACSPYLAFAVMLAAGLDGIERGLIPPENVTSDVHMMSAKKLKSSGIELLPGDLNQAIDRFEESTLMRECLGDEVFEYLLRNKREEWDAYRTRVSRWEIDRYLPLL
ncbi:MAG: glutamine synthetase family protein [Coriobacteriia bacterium]|nr:glutamine synthetase family protein [Coriobacteriia bacterium]